MLYQEHKDAGFVPISVVAQNANGAPAAPSDAALWASELGLTFPVLADGVGDFYATWDPEEILPIAYVIDRQGRVAWGEAGGAGGLDAIAAAVENALANE